MSVLPVGFGGASGGYSITNSARFNGTGDSLSRTIATPTSQQKFTVSFWRKFSAEMMATSGWGYGADFITFQTSTSTFTRILFGDSTNSGFGVARYNGSTYDVNCYATASYRDHSGWYHCVVVVDTTQATASDRVKFYLNGTQQTSAGTFPSLNYTFPEITNGSSARINNWPSFYDASRGGKTVAGYLADTYLIDGQALTPSSFGKTDSNGVWVPIKYAGTYGTNGCKLEFKNGGDLGLDTSGITTTQQMVDKSTGAIVGTMTNMSAAFDGNTSQTSTAGAYAPSSGGGPWYCGKNWNGVARSIYQVVAYPSTNGYWWDAGGSTVTLSLVGSNSSDPTTASTLGTLASFTDAATGAKTITASDTTAYKYHWLKMSATGATGNVARLCEVQFYEQGGNNWTVSGSPVQTTDTPTNNYATLNPLDYVVSGSTISNGNLTISNDSSGYARTRGTIGMSSGKWYFRAKISGFTGSYPRVGIMDSGTVAALTSTGIGDRSGDWAMGSDGTVYYNSTSVSSGLGSYTANDYVNVAVDLDAGKIWFGKNGTWAGNPDAGTGATITGLSAGTYFPLFGRTYTSGVVVVDFTTTAPANATSFKTLCTANLTSTAVTTSGTFTGNANADGPFVWTNGNPATLTINGNAVTFGTHADKTAGGFKLRSSSASYNTSGSNTWTATAGKRFVYSATSINTAQGNP